MVLEIIKTLKNGEYGVIDIKLSFWTSFVFIFLRINRE